MQIKIEVGTEVYNHGDQANASHFGKVVEIKSDRYGTQVKVEPQDSAAKPYWISTCIFSAEFKGHSGTRSVLKEAYQAWREASRAVFLAVVSK